MYINLGGWCIERRWAQLRRDEGARSARSDARAAIDRCSRLSGPGDSLDGANKGGLTSHVVGAWQHRRFSPPATAGGLRSQDGARSRRNTRLLAVQQNAADRARSRIRYWKGTPRPVRRVRRILYRQEPHMGGSRETHWTDSHVLQGCDRP